MCGKGDHRSGSRSLRKVMPPTPARMNLSGWPKGELFDEFKFFIHSFVNGDVMPGGNILVLTIEHSFPNWYFFSLNSCVFPYAGNLPGDSFVFK
jgi:hypothetical protein